MSKDLEKKMVSSAAEGCCGGLAPVDADACCIADAKSSGDDGCGCDTASAELAKNSCC